MNEELGLVRSATHHPHDPTPRNMLADWCEDHGQYERAESIRAGGALLPSIDDIFRECVGQGEFEKEISDPLTEDELWSRTQGVRDAI